MANIPLILLHIATTRQARIDWIKAGVIVRAH